MNNVILMGRLTRDPDTRYTTGENQMAVARFNLAVDRRGKDKGTDFINCVAFGKTGETVDKYLTKGTKIALSGRIQTGSYKDKDGKTVYTTDVVVNEFEFCERKAATEPKEEPKMNDGFITVPDDLEDLPFN